MAMITPDTFDPLRSYISVRLLQGVPLVDADWNEAHDVRKFEVQAFLKWFVGNGVPEGNDGFHIAGITSVRVKEDDPPVWNFVIQRGVEAAPAGTSLVEQGLRHVGRCLVDGMDVLITADCPFRAQPLHVSQGGAAAQARLLGVPTIAEIPVSDDPVVVYLDVWERLVTPDEEPGLVHSGLGVESSARLKREWVVRARAGSSVPTPDDPSAPDNPNRFIAGHSYYALATITNKVITDQRERRLLMPPATLIEDVFGVRLVDYRRGQGRPIINLREVINALLRGELPKTPELLITTSTVSRNVDVAADMWFLKDCYEDIWAFWLSPASEHSQRYEIWYNCYSHTSGKWGDDTKLPTELQYLGSPFALEDRAGNIWVFFGSAQGGGEGDIWYKLYSRTSHTSGNWGDDTQLTESGGQPFALEDRAGDIWVFWSSRRSGKDEIWSNRYSGGTWGDDTKLLTRESISVSRPYALEDQDGTIWVFWHTQMDFTAEVVKIWYKLYTKGSGWGQDTSLPTESEKESTPFALKDRTGHIWVFWRSHRGGPNELWYKLYTKGSGWGQDNPLATESTRYAFEVRALVDRAGDIWVFWSARRLPEDSENFEIWYKRYSHASASWGHATQLTTEPLNHSEAHPPFAIEDQDGTIWVFWSASGYAQGSTHYSYDIRYRKMFLAL